MLTDYEFKGTYHKLDDDIAQAFYLPCMRNSVVYKRISGYFGSTIYLIAWSALKEFIKNGGHMQVLCSPYLTEEDSEAIKCGVKAHTDAVLSRSFRNDFEQMLTQKGLSSASKLLACMIASGVMEIKMVIARDGRKKDPFSRAPIP